MTYQVWREKLISTLLKMRKYDEYSKLGEQLKDCMECDYCNDVVDTIIDEARCNKKFASHMLRYNLGDIFVGHSEIYTACIFTAAGY
jgi:Na+-translocating ferredoxin:NAD+ oxidoreductase RnfC subunit